MSIISNRIHLLDNISQSKIRSSVQILCLNDVVLELVKNALDAQAEHIKVVLNYAHGFCSVTDNGHGIPSNEFEEDGGLAKPFCTSKLGQRDTTYGCHGRYLAALGGLSLLSIASRISGGNTNVLWLDDSGHLRHTIEAPDTLELNTGTRVKVYGLFSKLPVRSKSQADRFANTSEIQREFGRLRHSVLGVVVASRRAFSIDVLHSSPKHVYRHRPYCDQIKSLDMPPYKGPGPLHSAIRQASFAVPSQVDDWQETSIQSGNMRLYGFISQTPVPHKLVQYLCLNHFPLNKDAQPDLFHKINALFEQSSFGSLASTDTGNAYAKQHQCLQNHVKAVDRWPMFAIWITSPPESVRDIVCNEHFETRAQKLLTQIANLIQTMIEEFLIARGFLVPRGRRSPGPMAAVRSIEAPNLNAIVGTKRRSNESFRHWSRIKSARSSMLDNFLTGLPFHEKTKVKQSSTSPLTSTDSPTGGDFKTTLVDDGTDNLNASPSSSNKISDQDYIMWTDPQTGTLLRLDSRTGMVLPEASETDNTSAANIVSLQLDPNTHRARSLDNTCHRHKRSQDVSLSQVARNVRLYSVKGTPNQDEPVRSICLFACDSDNVEGQRHPYKKKAELFWATADIHIDRLTQIERPSISRTALRTARVLRQVDQKFILALVQDQHEGALTHHATTSHVVLIDQHAADERCKVESLLRSLREDEAVILDSRILFEVSKKEATLLAAARAHFARWNILYEVLPLHIREDKNNRSPQQIAITGLPPVVAERCRQHPKFIIELLREEIWSDSSDLGHTSGPPCMPQEPNPTSAQTNPPRLNGDTPNTRHSPPFGDHLPPRLLEMINSRACRSAIMFNDKLSIEQCDQLVAQLSTCVLPFQCAHGRPSIVVLANLNTLPDHDSLAPTLQPTSAILTSQNRIIKPDPTRTTSPNEDASHLDHNNDRDSQPLTRQPVGMARARPPTRGLNTIEATTSFGQAYRAWIDSTHE